MPSYGAIRRNLDKQAAALRSDLADHFAEKWVASLEEFEDCAPDGRFEQVQWLRALAKIVTRLDRPASSHQASAWREFSRVCRLSMVAVHRGSPEAAELIRRATQATFVVAPRFVSAHSLARQLIDSLGPKLCARPRVSAESGPMTADRSR